MQSTEIGTGCYVSLKPATTNQSV